MKVGVLGRPAVYVSGAAVPLAGAREAGLLSLLHASAGRLVRAEQLADELWDGRPTSESALRVTVNRLRKRWTSLTGEDPVQSSPGGYRLLLTPGESDAVVYEDLVRRARAARVAGALAVATTLVDEGERLWRGRAYDGFEHLPTVATDHDRLEGLRCTALEERAATLVELGELDAALAEVDDLLTRHPYRESLWGLRMVALARSGRQRDALETFTRVRRMLDEELGIRPGEDLRELEQAILDQRPSSELTVPLLARTRPKVALVRARVPGRRGVLRLVGRDDELERLRQIARASVSSGVQVATVRGEPGIGKTALLERFAQEREDDGAHALIGRCDRTATVPLSPFLDALDPFIGPGGGPTGEQLADLLEASPDTIRRTDQLDVQRHRVLALLTELIAELTEQVPVLLGIDDAQWADPMTLALVDRIARAEPEIPLTVVLTIRDTTASADPAAVATLDPLLADLGREVPLHEVHLGGLPADKIEELLGGDVTPHTGRRILRASGGNPLYALQLHRLDRDDLEVPADLRRLCELRIDGLAGPTRRFLETAAVTGHHLGAAEMAAVLGEDRGAVAEHLVELQQRGLLEPAPGFDRFRFVHGLIRQTVYDQIEQGRRAELHLAVADALDRSPDPRAGEQALHLAEARPLATDARIAEAAMHAATEALRLGAYEVAVRYYRVVLGLVSPSEEQRATARFGLGLGLAADGDVIGSDATFADAIDEAKALGRWDLVADTVIARTRFGISSNIPEAMVEADWIDETLTHLGTEERSRQAHLLLWKAELLMNIEPDAANDALDRAAVLAAELQDAALDGLVAFTRIRQADARCEDPRRCRDMATAVLDRALAVPDHALAARAGLMLQSARLRMGDLPLARAEHPTIAELAAAANEPGLVLQQQLAWVSIVMATGPIDEADELSVAVTDDPGPRLLSLATVARMLHLTVVRREQLRLREIEPLLLGALALTPRKITRPLVATARHEVGDATGAHEQLAIFADELAELPVDWTYLATVALAAESAAELGHVALAEPLEQCLLEHPPQVVVACSLLFALGHVDRHLGLLAALRGDLDVAVERLSHARQVDEAGDMALWAAWSAHDEAAVRLRRSAPGDLDRAAQLLAAADVTATRLGSRRLLAAVAATRPELH